MRSSIQCIVLVSSLLLAVRNPVVAQHPVRLGIDGGVNFGNQSVSYDEVQPRTQRVGLIMGGIAEVGMSNLMFLQVEGRFIQKGTTYPEGYWISSGPEPIPETFTQLSYIEIPLLLKAKFGNSRFRPFVVVGPNVGFLLFADFGATHPQNSGDPSDVKAAYETFDLSVDIGGGIEYQLFDEIAFIGNVRFSKGLNNIRNVLSDYSIRSNGIQITFGTLFDL